MFVCYFVSPFLNSGLLSLYGGVHSSTPLHSATLYPLAPLDSSPPKYKYESDYESVAASAALLSASYKSMPDCSHNRRDTLSPGRRVDRSQRSRIGHVTIYCATVFCLLMMDFLIPSKPASPIASSNGG